jgi:hypothetical protein
VEPPRAGAGSTGPRRLVPRRRCLAPTSGRRQTLVSLGHLLVPATNQRPNETTDRRSSAPYRPASRRRDMSSCLAREDVRKGHGAGAAGRGRGDRVRGTKSQAFVPRHRRPDEAAQDREGLLPFQPRLEQGAQQEDHGHHREDHDEHREPAEAEAAACAWGRSLSHRLRLVRPRIAGDRLVALVDHALCMHVRDGLQTQRTTKPAGCGDRRASAASRRRSRRLARPADVCGGDWIVSRRPGAAGTRVARPGAGTVAG